MPLVADHMTRSLLTVSVEATIGEAAAAMAERGVGAVVVLEGDAIAAILTERDVMKAVAAGKDGSAPVADWMTRHPDTIEPGDTTDHAATLMIHGGFRHLPVVDDGKVVGIVSIRDLMKVALDDRSPRGVQDVVDWSELVAPGVRALKPLDVESTVEQVGMLGAHQQAAKLDWNENPFGPLPGVLDALGDELANVSRYPIEAYDDFRADAARSLGVPSGCVVPGHGTQALIGTVATTLLQPGDAVVQPAVTFYLYRMISVARGAVMHEAPMGARGIDLEAVIAKAREVDAKLVWICDPNNPTGTALERCEWEEFLDALPERCVVVADEAYMDFLPPDRRLGRERDVVDGKPLVVLRSFSKFFGLAGLRLGCAIADEALAGYLRVVDEPFNVNCVALAAGRASLRVSDEVRATRRREVADAREYLIEALVTIGARPYASEASFVLVQVDADDVLLAGRLLDAGVLVRAGSELGLPRHIRLTVGPPSVTDRLAAELGPALRR